MRDPRELPQLTNELIEMSRDYLMQETVEPAKALGKHAGMGIGGGIAFGLGGFFLTLALYNLLNGVLPEGEWYVVLARFLTFVAAGGAAGIVAWRIQSGGK